MTVRGGVVKRVAQRIRRRVMHWYWRNVDRLPDWVLDSRLFDISEPVLVRAGCRIAGHEPTRDQCGLPEHDFCLWCDTRMPGEWHPAETAARREGAA